MHEEHRDFLSTEIERLKMLKKPNYPIDVVMDTDAYNEVDDQFALSYLLCYPQKLILNAIYAAPFHNPRAETAEIGMELSYEEIRRIINLTGKTQVCDRVYKGARQFLPDEKTPVDSPAVQDLIQRAMEHTPDNPLYIIGIAAATNIASAILLQPEIVTRMVVLWLGGNALHWPDNQEFNLKQDIPAARVLLNSGVPLVLFPCRGVVSCFTVSEAELDKWFRGKNLLCDYLVDITKKEAVRRSSIKTWSRIIWDVTVVAWLLDKPYVLDQLIPSPIPQHDGHWSQNIHGNLIRYVYAIQRDLLLEDIVEKLSSLST